MMTKHARIETDTIAEVRPKPDNFDAAAATRKGLDWRDIVDLDDEVPGADERLVEQLTITPTRVERQRKKQAMTQGEKDRRDADAARAQLEAEARAVTINGRISNGGLATVLRFLMQSV